MVEDAVRRVALVDVAVEVAGDNEPHKKPRAHEGAP